MKNNIVVVFTENNARVIRNPDNLESYINNPNAIINPDLTDVQRIPPHLWAKDGDRVVKLSKESIENRIKHIDEHGCINHIEISSLEEIVSNLPVKELIGYKRILNRVISACIALLERLQKCLN